MNLKEYQESGRNFTCGGVAFQVMCWTNNVRSPKRRLVCWSTRSSNENGTNGIRWSPHYGLPDGFYAFISQKEIANVAEILAEESRSTDIQFTLDDEMTNDLGNGTHLFYKMRVLRSALVD